MSTAKRKKKKSRSTRLVSDRASRKVKNKKGKKQTTLAQFFRSKKSSSGTVKDGNEGKVRKSAKHSGSASDTEKDLITSRKTEKKNLDVQKSDSAPLPTPSANPYANFYQQAATNPYANFYHQAATDDRKETDPDGRYPFNEPSSGLLENYLVVLVGNPRYQDSGNFMHSIRKMGGIAVDSIDGLKHNFSQARKTIVVNAYSTQNIALTDISNFLNRRNTPVRYVSETEFYDFLYESQGHTGECLAGTLWVDKYRPRKLADFVVGSNAKEISLVKEWFENYGTTIHKPLLISGPFGVGKTVLVGFLSKENGYALLSLGPDEITDRESIQNLREMTRRKSSFVSGGTGPSNKLVVLEDIENIRYQTSPLLGILKDSKVPIICISSEPDSRLTQKVKTVSISATLKPIPQRSIKKRLETIVRSEKESEKSPEEISKISGGDLRKAINMLQFQYSPIEIRSNSTTKTPSSELQAVDMLCRANRNSLNLAQRLGSASFSNSAEISEFMFENYLAKNSIENLSTISEHLSEGAYFNEQIREDGEIDWSLMDSQRIISTLSASYYMSRNFGNKIRIPQYYAFLSKRTKYDTYVRGILERKSVRKVGRKIGVPNYSMDLEFLLYADGISDAYLDYESAKNLHKDFKKFLISD